MRLRAQPQRGGDRGRRHADPHHQRRLHRRSPTARPPAPLSSAMRSAPATHNRFGRNGGRSRRVSKQIAHVAQKGSLLPKLLNAFTRITSMLEGVLVSPRSARSGGTAMHAATSLSAHRRRPAGPARAGFRSTPAARKHRTRVTWMRAHWLCPVPWRRFGGHRRQWLARPRQPIFAALRFSDPRSCGDRKPPPGRRTCVQTCL
jgi:hypothetical protein